MKKNSFFYLLTLATAIIFASCTSETSQQPEMKSEMKASEVFVYSGHNQLNGPRHIGAKDNEPGYDIPDEGKYKVYYYIRIDGNIPGEDAVNLPSSAYFPRTATGKTMICELNSGYVMANAAWKSGSKFPQYIYSTDGSAVQSVIVSEPTLADLVAANQGLGDDFTGYIENQDQLHFLWYACKKQVADHVWHIDGILTSKDRTDISETIYGEEIMEKYKDMDNDKGDVVRKGHVEFDIHQQEHKDWNEIKTSIHLRDTVVAEVFLPIGYQALADDFDIRAGRDYEYITEIENCQIEIEGVAYELECSITHEQEGIRIVVNPNKEALAAAREAYDDGLTFEVHTYTSIVIPNDVIWDMLKQSTCTVTPYTHVFGQITSAYYPDDRVEDTKNF